MLFLRLHLLTHNGSFAVVQEDDICSNHNSLWQVVRKKMVVHSKNPETKAPNITHQLTQHAIRLGTTPTLALLPHVG